MAKWYFVEATPQQVEKLVKQRIPIFELEIQKPRHLAGIGFPEEELKRVRKVVDIPEKFVEEATEQDGVVLISPHTRVMVESENGMEHKHEVVDALKGFADTMDVDIFVKNVHGRGAEVPRTEAGKLFIRFWTTPNGAKENKTEEAFGVRLKDGQRDGCRPSGNGIQIKDNEGVVAAEAHGGTLYVLFDLPHGENAGKLMRLIMAKFLTVSDSKKWAEIQRETEERIARESRDRYVQECSGRMKEYIDSTKAEIKDVRARLKAVYREVVNLSRQEAALVIKAQNLSTITPDLAKRFGEEYDRLLTLPHVKNVVAQRGLVQVFTDTIFLEHDGKTYELGDYRIDMHTSGELNIVNLRAVELTGQTEYQHPHVFYEGGTHVCLGNIGYGIHQLMGSYEFSVAAQILIEFLHSMTKDSNYIHHLVSHWKPMEGKK